MSSATIMTITIVKTMYVVTLAAETVTAAKIINQISNNPSDTEVICYPHKRQ